MPPKSKFAKEEIIAAAMDIVRQEGMDAITARAIGAKLSSSAKVIFGLFQNMEEVQQAVVQGARQIYGTYVDRGLTQKEYPAFKGVGIQYIAFAMQEPKLFQLLFMSEQPKQPDIRHVIPRIDAHYPDILQSIQDCYRLNMTDAERLYRHMWVYTHGIAVLCAPNLCAFSAEEISQMLTEVHIAILKEIKAGASDDCDQ